MSTVGSAMYQAIEMLAASAAIESTSELNCDEPGRGTRLIFVCRITAKRMAGTTIALNSSVSMPMNSSSIVSMACSRRMAMAKSSSPCRQTIEA